MDILTQANRLEALGNPTRLAIYRALVRAGHAGTPVGKLQDAIGIPASTLSHHLAKLCACGLAGQTREGTVLRCRAHYDVMEQLVAFLAAECCADATAAPCETSACG
ncbi:metalloregulator ArsR/SmtB family transcription factor [Phreatobacter sp.]|jgi:DNA-binding transcriptional ArsR family regulator|uniref:ArsR/SmtB family transcription factor n=1 Tax=Phreatobacter sp. TaxID=1966341 RepID=UPI0025DC6DB0|nr:metalloregulator ArsR/SmtB family transcription factor [Phreatobacter sp.]